MFITLILKRIAAWRRYRANLRELGQLTDRELDDIGLSRGNVDYRRSHERRVLIRISRLNSKDFDARLWRASCFMGKSARFWRPCPLARPSTSSVPALPARKPPGKSRGAASRSCCTKCAR